MGYTAHWILTSLLITCTTSRAFALVWIIQPSLMRTICLEAALLWELFLIPMKVVPYPRLPQARKAQSRRSSSWHNKDTPKKHAPISFLLILKYVKTKEMNLQSEEEKFAAHNLILGAAWFGSTSAIGSLNLSLKGIVIFIREGYD